MARLLVTGAAGLIGQTVRRRLMATGHEVLGLDLAAPSGHPDHGDILDSTILQQRAVGCVGILHFAAIARVGESEADPQRCAAVNVDAVRKVLDIAAASPERPWVLLASSREVYGEPVRLPVVEADPIAPINVYGRSKAAAEALVIAARACGLRTQIARFANVYGRIDDHPDRVVPAFARAAAEGATMHLRGSNNAFDFTHVDDVAAGTRSLVDALLDGARDLPPIHFTTGQPTRLRALAELAQKLAGGRSLLVEEPSVDGTVARFWGDPDRARQLLGWEPRIDLPFGLARMIEAFGALATERALVA